MLPEHLMVVALQTVADHSRVLPALGPGLESGLLAITYFLNYHAFLEFRPEREVEKLFFLAIEFGVHFVEFGLPLFVKDCCAWFFEFTNEVACLHLLIDFLLEFVACPLCLHCICVEHSLDFVVLEVLGEFEVFAFAQIQSVGFCVHRDVYWVFEFRKLFGLGHWCVLLHQLCLPVFLPFRIPGFVLLQTFEVFGQKVSVLQFLEFI